MSHAIHHIEIWTTDLAVSSAEFDWILTHLGWSGETVEGWNDGLTWRAPEGEYIVLEQSPALSGSLNRMHAGVNHLALVADTKAQMDRMRSMCADHGWTELFAEKYPHAGGPDSYALYVCNTDGFELEIVVE